MRIKRSLQRGPKDLRKGKIRGPRRSTKRPQNAAHGKQNRAATTVGTTASPWWQPRSGRGDPLGRGGRLFPRLLVFLRVPLRLLAVFALVYLYIAMYLDIQGTPIHSIAIIFSIFHSFRLLLERERGSGEELRGFHTRLRSKNGNAFFR